jgi:membrane protease YdiL (CAAX protease family)
MEPASTEPLIRPEAPRPARIFPSLLVAFGMLPALFFVSALAGIALGVLALATGATDPDRVQEWLEEAVLTLPGLIAMTIPVQLMLIATGFGGAALSATPWRERLAWRAPGLGVGTWALILLGSLGVLLSLQLLADWAIEEPSEHLVLITRLLTETEGAAAVFMFFFFSVMPGFAEEVVFRGFVQTGLARRWPAWAAIGMSGLAFALIHLDPQHMTFVFPLGLWFGFLAWATRSVITAMIVHALNNLTAIALARTFGDVETGEIAQSSLLYALTGTLLLATALCAVHLCRRRNHAR